jgi:hypothetical protein
MAALGTTAPLGSFTVPRIVARSLWANATAAQPHMAHEKIRRFILPSLKAGVRLGRRCLLNWNAPCQVLGTVYTVECGVVALLT